MSSKFGKVRFINNTIVITPELINRFLRTRRIVEDSVDDINELHTVLTSGKYSVWTLQFPAANLTSLYSV